MLRSGSLTHAVATVPVMEAGLAGFMISCYYFIWVSWQVGDLLGLIFIHDWSRRKQEWKSRLGWGQKWSRVQCAQFGMELVLTGVISIMLLGAVPKMIRKQWNNHKHFVLYYCVSDILIRYVSFHKLIHEVAVTFTVNKQIVKKNNIFLTGY